MGNQKNIVHFDTKEVLVDTIYGEVQILTSTRPKHIPDYDWDKLEDENENENEEIETVICYEAYLPFNNGKNRHNNTFTNSHSRRAALFDVMDQAAEHAKMKLELDLPAGF